MANVHAKSTGNKKQERVKMFEYQHRGPVAAEGEVRVIDAVVNPEVFVLAEPLNEENTRTVYPPQADAHCKFAVSEVLDWYSLMDQVYEFTELVCAFLQNEIASSSIESANKIK